MERREGRRATINRLADQFREVIEEAMAGDETITDLDVIAALTQAASEQAWRGQIALMPEVKPEDG